MAQQADFQAQDEEARRVISTALDDTLFVEAGAGTGKTRALVDRVVALVLAGRKIDRIVAITFTEKAAAELKDRVRERLEAVLAEGGEASPLAAAALCSLDRAQLSTIHSFAQALLRAFAAEAGVDPAFQLQDEIMAERRLDERWRLYLEGLADEAEAVAAIDRALGLGLTTRDLGTLARELTGRAHLASILTASPPAASPPHWPDVAAMARALDGIGIDRAPPDDALRPRLEALQAFLHRLAAAGEERESVLASGALLLDRKLGVGRADSWGGQAAINAARDSAREICRRLQETLDACRAEALAGLLPYVVRFVEEDTRTRGRDGLLTFDDLILRVRGLLASSPAARRSLRQRYDALLIDEFQDTDPLQVDIALAFATDPASGNVEPGRLFLVGDPKQSIYRFRGADMAIYSRTRDAIEQSGGRFPRLALNRRSRGAILEWVNRVFSRVIGGGDAPEVQPPYHDIHPLRGDAVRGPDVAWFGGPVDATAREVRFAEAAAIAAQCRAVLDDGWQIVERNGTVPASFRHIAVLIPTRSVLAPLERALADARIPYRVEGGSLIYRTQEVRDVINCLTAIDDPADEVAVVAALRSPAFACSDVELARHRAAGGSFDYLSRRLAGQEGPVADGLRALAEYHAVRHRGSLAALVERFVTDRGLIETGILDQGDRNTFRRVRFLIEQARTFEAAGPESLRAFVSWLEHRAGGPILDYEGAGLDDDEDAVRVLTVHGAKGLEFPIVFVAGLGAAPRSQAPVFGLDIADGRVAVCIGAKSRSARFELGPVAAVSALEERHTQAEFDRLLYVAATRARDHLVLSLYHPSRSAKCGARRLIDAGAPQLANELPERPPAERRPARPFEELAVELPYAGDVAAFDEARTALVERSFARLYTSATALGERARAEEGEPWARGRGGTRLGRAVHAAIQSLPLTADAAAIEAFSQAQAVAEAVPDRWQDVARLVRAALGSAAAERARAALRALREVPFALQRDGVVLEGFIDLVIDTPEGLEIVDWKTDDVPPERVEERLQAYEQQAGLYVLGLEAATGRPVTSVTYVFVSAGREVSPGEPESLAKAAREKLEAMPPPGAA